MEFVRYWHVPHSFESVSGYDYVLELGLLRQSGDSPASWHRVTQANVAHALSSATGRLFGFTAAKTRKISLHLLDSILLI